MARSILACWLVAALWSATCPAAADDGAATAVGVARVDVTPSYPVRLHGFGFRRAESEGVTQPIWAKALAVGDDAAGPVVLITCDNLGVPDSLVEELAARLKRQANLPRERLAVTASHTHTAPMLAGVAPTIFSTPIPPEHQAHVDRYTREFLDQLTQLALAALADRRPSRLQWGIGRVGFATNRRTKDGPVDHDLPLLVVRDVAGKLRAVYVNYACHCVTLSNNKISGDWAGFAQTAIEREHPGCVALLSIGCGADANPNSGVTGDKTAVAAEQGGQIAAEVKRLLAADLRPLAGVPTTKLERIDLPLDTLPTRAQWEEAAKKGGAVGYHAGVNLARLGRGETLPTKISYPVQTWTFGDRLAMVFLPGEVVVDYALRLKREFAAPRLWINAYANAAPCYIPSERILREGGYEGGAAMVYYDLPARIAPGVEDKIVAAVGKQLPKEFRAPPADRTENIPPLAPQDALPTLHVRPGLRVELVAAEPLVESPVAIDWDQYGRLWVVEMFDYPTGLGGKFEPGGRVKRLIDSDRDGAYDKAEIVAEGLPFPTGVMAWGNGALVCAAPDILFVARSDARRERTPLFTGFPTENYQARVNSLTLGLDNWIHGANGLLGGTIRQPLGGDPVDIGGRDFRFRWRPSTAGQRTEFEAVAGLSQQGRVRDDWDHWFGNDNGNLLWHYPLPEHYLRRNPNLIPPPPRVSVPATDYDANRLYPISRPLPRFNDPGHIGRVTSACGPTIYRDRWLGDEFHGNAFICEPVHNLVTRLVLERRGATFVGRRAPDEQAREFLASTDNWFRPVQVRTGPDGGLWIVDMYRFVIEHPRWVSPSRLATLDVRAGANRGRIYRVVPVDAAGASRVRDYGSLTTTSALRSVNGPTRDIAHAALIHPTSTDAIRSDSVASSLRPTVLHVDHSGSPIERDIQAAIRIQALSVLEAIGDLNREPSTVRRALADPHPRVREFALRLAARGDQEFLAAERLPELLRDDDPGVTLQLAFSLGDAPADLAGTWLARLALRRPDDDDLAAAVGSSLGDRRRAHAFARAVVANLPRGPLTPPQSRRLLQLALAAADPELTLTIVDLVVSAQTPSQASYAAAADFLDRLEDRGQSLDDLAKAAKTAPPDWRGHVEQYVAAAGALAADADADPQTRLVAVRLLGRISRRREADLKALFSLLGPQHEVALRTAAIERLGRNYAPEIGAALLADWPSYTPTVRTAVIDLLLRRVESAESLLNAIAARKISPGEISATQRQHLVVLGGGRLKARLDEVLGNPTATDRGQVVAAYRSVSAMSGDKTRGATLFQQKCAACHRPTAAGAALAPDLAALTDKSVDALLIAVLDPNRAVDGRYVSYTAQTQQGLTYTGMLVAETATSLTLAGAEGQRRDILRRDLAAFASSGKSLMPEGLEKDISQQDVADLAEYIRDQLPPRRTFDGNAPATVAPGADGRIVAPATAAEIYGSSLVFEPEFKNLGFWHGGDDQAIWRVTVPREGKYTVALDYACHADAAGNEFQILAAGQRLVGRVPATERWDNYQRLEVGALTLPAGSHALTIRAAGPVRGALFDLRAVELRPR